MELTKEIIREEVLKRKEDILRDAKELIQIESYTHTPNVRDAVEYMSTKGEKEGFIAKVVDHPKEGLSMHLHWGNENDIVGILGHLDTVPAVREEWDFDPHSGDVVEGYLLGRGAQDDKGPMACVYNAVKIIRDLKLPVSKGVRLIYGTKEEGGIWTDIAHYFTQEKTPSISFTPDSEFPLLFAEKGITRIGIKGKVENKEGFSLQGGTVPNAVPSKAFLNLNGKETIFEGTALHAMLVWQGCDSALYKAIAELNMQVDNELIKLLNDKFINDPKAEKIGLAYETKEEGPLSCNLGVLKIESDGSFEIIFDLRWPVAEGKSHNLLLEAFKKEFAVLDADHETSFYSTSNPLYVPQDSHLVTTLENAYRKWTGETPEEVPLKTTGGGTYAKALPNCVSFGMLFEDDERTLHMKNERANVDNMLKATMIYVEAIYQLMK